jgi:hypothetical protein
MDAQKVFYLETKVFYLEPKRVLQRDRDSTFFCVGCRDGAYDSVVPGTIRRSDRYPDPISDVVHQSPLLFEAHQKTSRVQHP